MPSVEYRVEHRRPAARRPVPGSERRFSTFEAQGRSVERVISFVPGPSHVRDDVLAAMATTPLPHRSDAFRQIVRRVQRGLGLLLSTASPVFPVLGSGTTAVEIALRGVARSRVLVVANGNFG